MALITPLVSGSTFGAGGEAKHAVTISGGGKQFLSAQITGTAANLFGSNNRQLDAGTTFTQAQAQTGARVSVIGPSLAGVLFGSNDAALGKTINVKTNNTSGRPFVVLGVMKDYGKNLNNRRSPRSCRRAITSPIRCSRISRCRPWARD